MCSQQAWMWPLSPPSKNQFSITIWQLFLKMRKNCDQMLPFQTIVFPFGDFPPLKKWNFDPYNLVCYKNLFKSKFPKSFCKSTKQVGDWSQHSIWSAHNNVACLMSDLISPLMMYRTQEASSEQSTEQFNGDFTFGSSGPETVPGTGDQPMWPQGQ